MSRDLYAAVETGGTKILCRVVDADGDVLAEERFATSTPDQALADLTSVIEGAARQGRLRAIGMASFGPVVVDASSPDYGLVPLTPKPHWSGANLRAALAQRFGVPVALDTDVNAAALAEAALGAGAGEKAVAYVTVGTGVGGGISIDGAVLHGRLHAEVGHMRLHRAPGDTTPSFCPFHDDCIEGLAAGPAVQKRLLPGERPEDRPDLRSLIAGYLAEALGQLTLAWAPDCVVIGGGVLAWPGLLEEIDARLKADPVAYGPTAAFKSPAFLRRPHFENAGLEGALLLARRAAEAQS